MCWCCFVALCMEDIVINTKIFFSFKSNSYELKSLMSEGDLQWLIPCSQAAVFGSDWISELASCSAPIGSFLHQERRPAGLRSCQDCTYKLSAWEITLTWSPSVSLPLSSFQVYRRPNFKELSQDCARCQRWLNKKRIKAFYTSVFADNLRHGTQFLLQVGIILCIITRCHLYCFMLVACV